MIRAPIGPDTVTVDGSRWEPGPAWDGFGWHLAKPRKHSIWSALDLCDDDPHLLVPWRHADDQRVRWENCGRYRLRVRKPWDRFVCVDGTWMVERLPKAAEMRARGATPEPRNA